MNRQDFNERLSPIEVVALLKGFIADDPVGRAALVILLFPGTISLDEAIVGKFPEEMIHAAAISEAASLEAAAGGPEGN